LTPACGFSAGDMADRDTHGLFSAKQKMTVKIQTFFCFGFPGKKYNPSHPCAKTIKSDAFALR